MFDNASARWKTRPCVSPYTLGGACACFLVECTRANSITRPENGEESFETLGFEKNFVRTINNMTQRRNTFRKADEKSRAHGSFARRDHLDEKGRGEKKKEGKRGDDITFTREKSLDISRRTTAALAISRAEFCRIAQTF